MTADTTDHVNTGCTGCKSLTCFDRSNLVRGNATVSSDSMKQVSISDDPRDALAIDATSTMLARAKICYIEIKTRIRFGRSDS